MCVRVRVRTCVYLQVVFHVYVCACTYVCYGYRDITIITLSMVIKNQKDSRISRWDNLYHIHPHDGDELIRRQAFPTACPQIVHVQWRMREKFALNKKKSDKANTYDYNFYRIPP